MNPPNWRIEDGLLLQQLRQNAKIDDFVFARMNAISQAQLRELEGQGEGSFYNAQIKTNTGLKLLRKLGHEPVLEIQTPTAEPVLETAPASDPVTPMVSSLATSRDADRNTMAEASGFPRNPTGIHPKWAAALLLAGGLVWSVSHMPWPEFTSPTVPSTATATATATAPAPSSSAQPLGAALEPTASSTATQALPDTSTSTSKSLPEISAVGTAIATANDDAVAACDWRHQQSSATYEATAPIKTGNYIHFLASQDVRLCVRDHQNRLTDLHLKAGSAQSVYGTPPFLVHSANWPNLQIFYQGRPVGGAPKGGAYWVFKNKDI